MLDPASTGHELRIEQAETEIDNLRAAFAWSRENSDIELASALASSLQPLWLGRGRLREGLAWFNHVLTEQNAHQGEVAPAVRARTLADKAVLDASSGATESMDQAQQALAIARELDDPALLARALTACGYSAGGNPELARPYFDEASSLARALGDGWRLSQILGWQALGAVIQGDPIAGRAAAEEGREFADAIGDRFDSRQCRWCLGMAQCMQGDLVGALAQFGQVIVEAGADHDVMWKAISLTSQGFVLALRGDTSAARAAADAVIESGTELGGIFAGLGYAGLALTALAAGDVAAAQDASEGVWQRTRGHRDTFTMNHVLAQVALARGDLIAAQGWADEAVSTMLGWHLTAALTARARVAIAQGEPEQAERDAHDALECAASIEAHQGISDILECLAGLAAEAGDHPEAAELFGAAAAIRERTGEVRFKIYQAGYEASLAALRDAMGEQDFDCAWAEGAALSTDEAIACAQRGRGERKRPMTG